MAAISAEEWRTLEPLLDAALDVDLAERAAHLDAVCAGAPERRARLEALLADCEAGEQLLLTPAESFAPLPRISELLGGRYRIIRELGHGGMATVYLAEDPKHRRQVAVKVLDVGIAESSGDSRFLQEIEIAARLQHPNILPLFDSGDADGLRYYVMPFVEGETVRDRLLREKQLPVEDAIRTAQEVAEALDFAHRQGIVHRDIKPENILQHDGRSLVADFGIALAVSAAAAGQAGEAGMLIGTPHYMSPEQAAGEGQVDNRSDIYSLGVLLYEMLTGEPPHSGTTAMEVISKIVTVEVPAVTVLRRRVPPHVESAIAKATELLPADRFVRAQEFSKALADPNFRYGALAAAAGPTPSRWNPLAITLAAVAAVAAVAASVFMLRQSAVPAQVVLADIKLAAEQSFVDGTPRGEVALSADGSLLVWVGRGPGGGRQLWRRRLNDTLAEPITNTEGAFSPALAPDGRMVAFEFVTRFRPGVSIVPVRDVAAPSRTFDGGTMPVWSSSDALYYSGPEGRIYRASTLGGEPEAVTSPMGAALWYPDVLPGGALLVTVFRGPPPTQRIAVVEPKSGAVREILAGLAAQYDRSSRHIVFSTADGALWAQPFDVKRLEVTGQPSKIADGLKVKPFGGRLFALSAKGSLAYQPASDPKRDLVWVTRRGGVEPLDTAWRENFQSPSLSPDGKRLAVAVLDPRPQREVFDLWIRELGGGTKARLPLDRGTALGATWTPDGQAVTFASFSEAQKQSLWTRRPDAGASTVPDVFLASGGEDVRWSPDGRWLVWRTGFFGQGNIMGLRPGRDAAPVALVADTAFGEWSPVISPDGRWLAYVSNETGSPDVYVRPFPNTSDRKWQVSTTGGTEPVWAHSGNEVFYRNQQNQMVSVSVGTKPTFSVGESKPLFSDVDFFRSQSRPQYDVSADDDRFIMVRRRANPDLKLVTNWPELLKRPDGK